MPDLHCAVVHWNVPDLLFECLRTLLAEAERLRQRGVAVEVAVVDNASEPEVRHRLRCEIPDGVRVLWPNENLGYPRACNLAYASTDAPLVLLSNPDLLYRPGSLSALLESLEKRPEAALAGPAAWWDRDHTLLLNPGYPEDRERIEEDAAAKRKARWPEHALSWQRRMAEVTFAAENREIDIISGASILVRRERIEAAGGLFDPSLFLYYDDTDLCHRLRSHDIPALYVPGAHIVHLFNQSGRTDVAEHMAASRRHYLTRHYGEEEAARLLELGAEAVPTEEEFEVWQPLRMGVLQGPPSFTWDAPGRSLFALGLNPQLVPAAMAWRDEGEISFTDAFCRQLVPGPYWARATDPSSETVYGYWNFVVP